MLTNTIIEFIRFFRRNVDSQDIKIFLESSPQYPNLLSVMHTLHYAGLDCHAGKCDWDYLSKIKSPFLLHFVSHRKEKLVISKWDANESKLKCLDLNRNHWSIMSQGKAMDYWDGVVIYDDIDNPLNQSTIFNKSAVIIVALLSIVLIVFCAYFEIIEIYLPIVLGLLFGCCLFINSVTNNIGIIDQICHIAKATDCNRVDKSTYSNIFGFKLNWLVLSFFLSQLITVFICLLLGRGEMLYTLYSISVILCIPAVGFSTYSQFKVKKICPFCIAIAICLIAEAIIFCCMDYKPLNLNIITLFSIIFAISALILRYISIFQDRQGDLVMNSISLLKLKRSDKIFLSESTDVNKIKSPIVFGDKESRVHITTIISPQCKYCRELAAELIALRQNGLHFYWKLVLGQSKTDDFDIIDDWIHLFLIDEDKFIKNLILWSDDATQISLHNSDRAVHEDRIKDIRKCFKTQIANLNISGFPRIIFNNKMLSPIYTAKDIKFLIIDKNNKFSEK